MIVVGFLDGGIARYVGTGGMAEPKLVERTRAAAETAQRTAENLAGAAGGYASGVGSGFVDAITGGVFGEAGGVIGEVSSIVRWGTVAIVAVLAFVALLIGLYLTAPVWTAVRAAAS